ncbi:MAG: sulfatase [Planctomycetes bacterium]|nr:sulfatase [Planctomycetota bacterium]
MTETATASQPPNVVLIISDDQAWGDYGFMGHPHIQTPRLDQLARESLVFSRGYVPSSLCCPSLATMITGLYPHEHRITGNDPPATPGVKGLRNLLRDPTFVAVMDKMDDNIERVPTLPRMLAERGYLSLQTGKWWHGSYARGGFTDGMTHGDRARGGRHGDAGLTIGREGLKPIRQFLDKANQAGKPFFVWYAPFLPHQPHNPPEWFLSKYRDKTDSIHVAKYWAMCEWFDETCGQVLDLLEEKKVADNTIVLYVCDNGWINQHDTSGYMPRSKRSPYDGGVRTPIMIRWPGHLQPAKCEHLASSMDLAPTILAACGLSTPAAMSGVDLLDSSAVAARERIFGEVFTHNAIDIDNPSVNLKYRWCIDGSWKLILPNSRNVKNGEIELFHLTTDPNEKHNLAADRQEIVARLRGHLEANWQPE